VIIKMTQSKPKLYLKSDVNPSSKQAYKKFVQETNRSDISYELFRNIILKMNEKILEKVITGRYKIRFPKLGLLSLIRVTPTKLIKKIDWGRYRKDGVYTTFKNYHTDGMMYRIFFYFYERKYPHFGFYNFKLSKPNQVMLGQKIKNNEIR
jgi:hypothetical protein